MEKGKLYGVSVGPGDPELLTVKALKAISSCKVIAAPVTGKGASIAFDIARQAVNLSGKKLLRLPFLMTRDKELLKRSHAIVAGTIASELDGGADVAMLNLGDISVYSTFSYIMEMLSSRGYEVEAIPGVTSFCAAAAKLGTPLTGMESPLHIIPAGEFPLDQALDLPGSKVLMKSGKALPEVKEALRGKGLYEKASMVRNCGLPGERICRSLDEDEGNARYFSVIIVKE